jgi:regulator of protease activity HflC (stomatin/prohibitin superfamily)
MSEYIKKYSFLGILFIIFVIILNSFTIIGAGKRGVLVRFGAVQSKLYNEGIHFKIPLISEIKILDVQTQKLETQALAYSKDIQTVESSIALNYHIKPDAVNKLYQEVGNSYQSRIIDPSIQESVKSATAKFTAQELIEQRPKVKEAVKAELLARLDKYFIVDDFSIINFSFSDEYEKAIEEKQVAQQAALKAKNDLERIKTEAEQRVAEAEAEAKAIQIQAKAITQQGGREYVNLKAIEKWNGVLPQTMLPGGSVPFIELNQ